jgi:hypothetical protein
MTVHPLLSHKRATWRRGLNFQDGPRISDQYQLRRLLMWATEGVLALAPAEATRMTIDSAPQLTEDTIRQAHPSEGLGTVLRRVAAQQDPAWDSGVIELAICLLTWWAAKPTHATDITINFVRAELTASVAARWPTQNYPEAVSELLTGGMAGVLLTDL